MKNPVIIKGDRGGIHIIIEPGATLRDILLQLELMLKSSRSDYKNSKPINIIFDGKILTDDEKREILFLLTKIGLNVYHNENEQESKDNIENSNIRTDNEGLFYIGNLKNGQSINAMCSIVIIGNVEKGASVYSNGNIVITGFLEGFAKAGCLGKEDAFVFSLISGRNI